MNIKLPKVLRVPGYAEAPALQPGDSFAPLVEYVGHVSAAYFDFLKASEDLLAVTSFEVDPVDYGAEPRSYQLAWCTSFAQEVARAFACDVQVLPYSSRAIFYGEFYGIRAAGALYAYVVAQVDRFAPAEYMRRYKRAKYHGEVPEYGWRKSFIKEGGLLLVQQNDVAAARIAEDPALADRVEFILSEAAGLRKAA